MTPEYLQAAQCVSMVVAQTAIDKFLKLTAEFAVILMPRHAHVT